MAQTVGTHGVAVFTSPSNGDTLDATVVKGNDNNLRSAYVDHDADGGLHVQSSSLATRSSPGLLGRKWLTTDPSSYRLFFDDGSAWYELSYLSTNGGTVTGNMTVTGTLTASVTGPVTGNASTATALQTARNINGVAFNGTADITVTAAAGTLSGSTLNSGVTASSLTSVGTLSTLQVSGNATFDTNTLYVDATNNRVGVGTAAPTNALDVAGSARVRSELILDGVTKRYRIYSSSSDELFFARDTSAGVFEAVPLRIDSSGNLGLGVVPSASFLSSIESEYGLLVGRASANISQNAYYSTTGWRYIAATAASLFAQDDGVHQWLTAPSGTAGNAITFTQAMTLDASGALLVGTTTSIDSRFRVGGTHPATSTLQYGALIAPTFNTSATSAQLANYGQLTSAAGTYTTTDAATYWAAGSTLGAGHTVTNLYGFYYAGRATAGATNNYGLFVGNVSNGTSNFSIFTGTGKVRFGDVVIGANGTASAPAYSANADENTGLFFPAADVIGLSTGGTERARIDSSGNLGLDVTPSAWGAGTKAIQVRAGTALYNPGSAVQSWLMTNSYNNGTNFIYTNTGAAGYYAQNGGIHAWHSAPSGTAGAAISFTQAMTLDASGQLALGTASASATLGRNITLNGAAAGTNAGIVFQSAAVERGVVYGNSTQFTLGSTTAIPTVFTTNNVERARIDSSGNLGLGVTPSAWNSSYKAIDVGNSLALIGSASAADLYFNAYIDSGSTFRYRQNAAAGAYSLALGQHRWYNAPSGTAGAAISLTQAMLLDQTGNLGLGVTPSAWTDANNRGLDIGVWASVAQVGGSTMVGLNTYATTSSGGWTYKNTSAAMLYRQVTAGHQWLTAPSGTGGAAISFTQAMTLSSSGNLTIGGTNESARVRIEGTTNLSTALQVFRSGNSCGAIWQEASAMRFGTDGSTGFTEKLRVDATTTAGQTALLLWDVDNGTMERVTVGAADSGGTGFKVLRIPN